MTWVNCIEGGKSRVNHAGVLVGDKFFSFGGYGTELAPPLIGPEIIGCSIFDLGKHSWYDKEYGRNETGPDYLRYGHSVTYYRNRIFLWGGLASDNHKDSLFVFNLEDLKWNLLRTHGREPSLRDGHASCLVKNQMYIFGGFDYQSEVFSCGFYSLNLDTLQWTKLNSDSGEFSCRDFHSLVAVGRKLYLFGGRSTCRPPQFRAQHIVYPNTIHVYDIEQNQWTELVPKSNIVPIGRRSHCMFFHKEHLYIFGGYNCLTKNHYNDLWKFNINDQVWVQVATLGLLPSPRRRMVSFVYQNHAYFYGGTQPSSGQAIDESDESYDPDKNLKEISEIQVLDLDATLASLCFLAIKKYNLNYCSLPRTLMAVLSKMN